MKRSLAHDAKRPLALVSERAASVAEEPRPVPSRPVPAPGPEPCPSRAIALDGSSSRNRRRSPRSDLQGAARAVDAPSVFADAAADLAADLAAYKQHGPGYLRRCIEAARSVDSGPTYRPPELPPLLAQLIRDRADDAVVRALSRNPSPLEEVS